ncbi:ParB/RepB/Spo0J family partition protein [Cognatishimia maritima]|nr:ParB N-terminal domain-containing protein [Cognatishimia maritima]
MAKRKRLTPANPAFFADPAPAADTAKRAPIADVASDASAMAALEELTQRRKDDLENGRLVQSLPLSQIDLNYLVRDRVAFDEAEMETLVESIRTRGQQMPIEVVVLDGGRYGLISGWRRCEALRRLAEEAGQGVAMVEALLRKPDQASDAYLAMVEENEIRVGLSYFERARIAMKAVEQGVFDTEKQALLSLFRAASRAKRSKIRSFLTVVDALGDHLTYPQAIGERLGLGLAKQIEDDAGFAAKVLGALQQAKPDSAEAEQAQLQALLNESLKQGKTVSNNAEAKAPKPQPSRQELRPGLVAVTSAKGDRLELSGEALTPQLRAKLLNWLKYQR